MTGQSTFFIQGVSTLNTASSTLGRIVEPFSQSDRARFGGGRSWERRTINVNRGWPMVGFSASGRAPNNRDSVISNRTDILRGGKVAGAQLLGPWFAPAFAKWMWKGFWMPHMERAYALRAGCTVARRGCDRSFLHPIYWWAGNVSDGTRNPILLVTSLRADDQCRLFVQRRAILLKHQVRDVFIDCGNCCGYVSTVVSDSNLDCNDGEVVLHEIDMAMCSELQPDPTGFT